MPRKRAKTSRVQVNQPTHYLETLEDVKRKFGTTPFDRWEWPAENIHEEPTRCMRVNLEWWPLIAGWLSVLAQPRVWKDVLTKDAHPVEQILELMIGENCVPFQLRQDTVNSCLIEQTLDGGDTWLPAFDLSLCLSIVDGSSGGTTINNFYTSAFSLFEENVYNYFVANYVNKITNIVPELGYGDEFDGNRDEALCFALSRYVDIVCEQAIAYFDGLDETANDLRTNLALAAAIIGIVALAATGVGTPAAVLLASQAALWAGGIGIATFLGVALFDHFTDTNRSAYEDLGARDEVVCCLLDALQGDDVDRDDFQGAFACAGLSTNAQAIHDAADIIAAEDATYAAFIENMRIGFNSAKLGLLPNCVCLGIWLWEYAETDCNYGLPDGWSLDIITGQCGSGPGTFDGLYEYTADGPPATLRFTINPLGETVSQIRLVAAANVSGFTSTYIHVSQGAFLDEQDLLADWNTYTYFPDETGIITIELNHTGSNFQGCGVREIQIDF